MAKVLQAFTDRQYVKYDEEGNRSVISGSEATDDDGNVKDGVSVENVNYAAGDDYEGSDAPAGFVEGAVASDDDGEPALKKGK